MRQNHDGHRMGCLPRRTRPGQTCPLFSSRIKVIPRSDWESLAKNITLRPFVKNVYDQGQVGSCASESMCQAVAISRATAGLTDVLFNPYGVYHFVNGGRDQGSTLDDNLNFGREYGCFPESVWPRSKGWQSRPDEEAMAIAKNYRIVEYYEITTVEEFVSALLLGIPVTFGAKGHAVTGTKHLHQQMAPEIINSWSERWKDGGFGIWATYAELSNMLQYGVYAVRTTTTNSSLFQEPAL